MVYNTITLGIFLTGLLILNIIVFLLIILKTNKRNHKKFKNNQNADTKKQEKLINTVKDAVNN